MLHLFWALLSLLSELGRLSIARPPAPGGSFWLRSCICRRSSHGWHATKSHERARPKESPYGALFGIDRFVDVCLLLFSHPVSRPFGGAEQLVSAAEDIEGAMT